MYYQAHDYPFFMLDSKYCKTESNEFCEFPFEYKKQKYDTCIDIDNGGKSWCYSNFHKDYRRREWNTCKASSCPRSEGEYILYQ